MMPAKLRREDLALFGGRPLFDEPLHVGRPNIGDREVFLESVGEILDRRWLTNDGPVVQRFEAVLADRLGVRNCIAVCNATVALQILFAAAGAKGEVILPSFTFVATAHAVAWQGLSVAFADVLAVPPLSRSSSESRGREDFCFSSTPRTPSRRRTGEK